MHVPRKDAQVVQLIAILHPLPVAGGIPAHNCGDGVCDLAVCESLLWCHRIGSPGVHVEEILYRFSQEFHLAAFSARTKLAAISWRCSPSVGASLHDSRR